MLTESELLQHKMVKVFPHIIDTILLISGISIAMSIYGAFYQQPWLVIKLVALVVYIILGSFALRYGKTKRIRAIYFVLALGVFSFIITLAISNAVYPIL